MTRITLARIGKHETVRYAVEELVKYLKLIDIELMIDVRLYDAYDPTVGGVIWVGEDPAFDSLLLPVEDRHLDDAIYINIKNNAGIITGSNVRAVLIAAYRFLRERGIAWVRPSDDGEVIPNYTIVSVDTDVCEKASYRHRAVCIEGNDCYENISRMIEWIPRAGMSGYYFQFLNPYYFFEKWYNHICNELYPVEPMPREDVKHMVEALKEEVAKRSLLLHYVGHGWTSGPLGFTADGWGQMKDEEIPEEKRHLLAMIDGKRGFFTNTPLNTNLCYSNPEARSLIVNAIADYCGEHPEVDYLHFWLADCLNNHCECENCVELPADYYLMMLNEVDALLTERGIDTKVVFLIYCDLLWAPEKVKLNNPERFVLMFAPIARGFLESFGDLDPTVAEEHAPFVRNKATNPTTLAGNVTFLRDWQKVYTGDSFDFDYHLCLWKNRDFGFFDMSRILFEDMKHLRDFGMGGMMSCQLNRAAFPSNLPMQMMADALWNAESDFETQSEKYCREAYGADGLAVKEFLRAVSDHLELREALDQPHLLANYKDLLRLIFEFDMTLSRNLTAPHLTGVKKSWEYMAIYRELLLYYVRILIAQTEGNEEKKARLTDEALEYARCNEAKYYKTLELYTYISVLIRNCGLTGRVLKDEAMLQMH